MAFIYFENMKLQSMGHPSTKYSKSRQYIIFSIKINLMKYIEVVILRLKYGLASF